MYQETNFKNVNYGDVKKIIFAVNLVSHISSEVKNYDLKDRS